MSLASNIFNSRPTILRASFRFGRAHLFDVDTCILVIMSFPRRDDVGNTTVRASDPTMLSGFDSSTTDRTCFDWDDGDGAFSVTNTNQARRRDDDNEDSEEEAIDCMAKNVMNFILIQQEEEGDRRQEGGHSSDNVPIKKTRQPKRRRAICVNGDGSVCLITPRQRFDDLVDSRFLVLTNAINHFCCLIQSNTAFDYKATFCKTGCQN